MQKNPQTWRKTDTTLNQIDDDDMDDEDNNNTLIFVGKVKKRAQR